MTAKSNEIERLLVSEILPTINDVLKEMKAYKKLYEEFIECNSAVMYLKDEEKDADQQFWFQPKSEQCLQFMTRVKKWIEAQSCDQENTAG